MDVRVSRSTDMETHKFGRVALYKYECEPACLATDMRTRQWGGVSCPLTDGLTIIWIDGMLMDLV